MLFRSHKEADQHEKNLKRKWELLESRKDDIKTKLDSELRQEGVFPDGLVLDLPEPIGILMPPSTLVGESTAQRTKMEIIACLLDNEVGKIGVYGMGGIGKTTVIKEVNNFLFNESNRFESVIWVTVSKEFDLIKLQNDIASRLALELPKFDDEIIRAAKLYTALKDRRYVLILDDLWETFALEKVGIPEPTPANGCKIVLTTRYLDVCRGMSCKDIKMELDRKSVV